MRAGRSERCRKRPSLPKRPSAQVDQVTPAEQLEHGERRDRLFNERPDAEADGDDLGIFA